jgi:primosomal protein N' (replication factor Y)
MTRYAEIALPLPLDRNFTYSVPPEFEARVRPGMRALVPFSGRTLTGFVVGIRKRRPAGGLKLKPITDLPDETPTFGPALLDFTRRLGRTYFVSWGEALQAAVPPSFVPKSKACYSLTEKGREALAGGSLPEGEKDVALRLAERPHTVRYLERTCPPDGLAALLDRMRRKTIVSARAQARQAPASGAAPVPPRQLEPISRWTKFRAGRGGRRSGPRGPPAAAIFFSGSPSAGVALCRDHPPDPWPRGPGPFISRYLSPALARPGKEAGRGAAVVLAA